MEGGLDSRFKVRNRDPDLHAEKDTGEKELDGPEGYKDWFQPWWGPGSFRHVFVGGDGAGGSATAVVVRSLILDWSWEDNW